MEISQFTHLFRPFLFSYEGSSGLVHMSEESRKDNTWVMDITHWILYNEQHSIFCSPGQCSAGEIDPISRLVHWLSFSDHLVIT